MTMHELLMDEYIRKAAASFCANRGLPFIDHDVLAGVIKACMQEATRTRPGMIRRFADWVSPLPGPCDL
jgi:hypothetical protein